MIKLFRYSGGFPQPTAYHRLYVANRAARREQARDAFHGAHSQEEDVGLGRLRNSRGECDQHGSAFPDTSATPRTPRFA